MTTGATTKYPLSDRLADLSQRARTLEDSFAAARAENRQKVEARMDQARKSVEQLKQHIQEDASTATQQTQSQWKDLQGRLGRRIDKINADFQAQKQQFAADRALVRADFAEDEAAAAIDDARGAVEYARYAVLNAVAARLDADNTD